MIRRIIIIGLVFVLPVTIYLATRYGQPPSVSFAEAIERTQHTSESDPASKVLIEVTITSAPSATDLIAVDAMGQTFRIEYTGSTPETPIREGTRARYVGHVHGGDTPIFHATQVLVP